MSISRVLQTPVRACLDFVRAQRYNNDVEHPFDIGGSDMSTTTAPAGALRREEQAPQHNRQAAQGHLGLAPERRIMSRHSTGLRLTRRGRVVLLVLLLLAVLAAFSMGRATGSADAASSSPPPASVVVRPGDTLWSIAQQVAPDADPRQVIPRLKAANGLTSSRLDVGQRLWVPGAR